MAVTLTLTSDFQWVLASAVGIFFTNLILGFTVGRARKEFGVKIPQMYGPNTTNGNYFNRYQRGHQNMLETIASAHVFNVLVGLFYPVYSAKMAFLWCVGRFVYAVGYWSDPKYRVIGEFIYFPALIGWFFGMYSAAQTLSASA